MLQSYWEIGRLIVDNEQKGQTRAEYGKEQLKLLSIQLTKEFGRGFDITNLQNMRRFYLVFEIRETLSLELSWSHYNVLARVENPSARDWYMKEALACHWSVRALERQIGVLYYERLLSSKDKVAIEDEAKQKNSQTASKSKRIYERPVYLGFSRSSV
jgi:hypothetical protein